jgi:inorganic triphosphatase YgiF
MSYADAYTRLMDSALHSLDAIEEQGNVLSFVLQTAAHIQELSAQVPEFYIGEFFNMFKDAAVKRFRIEMADCEQTLRDAKADAASASAQLQARLDTARAAGDRVAEHAIWREREVRQKAYQAKVDAASSRMDVIGLRIKALPELASALGIDF